MEYLREMSNEKLTDMLAEKTSQYTKLFKANDKREEFAACKKIIDQLTEEIKRRKQTRDSTVK